MYYSYIKLYIIDNNCFKYNTFEHIKSKKEKRNHEIIHPSGPKSKVHFFFSSFVDWFVF